MFDAELIKNNYSQMADEQLIYLAKNEGTLISHEAFIFLKKEFRKRNLSPEVISETEKARSEKSREKIINNLEKESDRTNNKLWNEIFDLKAEGLPDSEIKAFLLNEGLSNEESEFYIGEMKAVAETTIKKIRIYILRAVCSLLFGFLLLVWNYYSFISITAIIVGIVIFLSSAGAWAKLDSFQARMKKALLRIKEDKSN